MAGDVSRYLVNNELQDVVLVGHSMCVGERLLRRRDTARPYTG